MARQTAANSGSPLPPAGAARLRLGLLEQAPVPLLVTTLEGRVVACNRAAEQLFGTSRDGMVRASLTDLAAGLETRRRVHELLAAVARGETWEGALHVEVDGGECILARFRCSPLRNSAGSATGAICVPLTAPRGEGTSRAAEIGARIARARKQRGWTQQELAERLGVTRRSVQAYETGRVTPYKRFAAIAAALEQPVSRFLADEVPSKPTSSSVEEAQLRRLIREELAGLLASRDATAAV